MIVGSVGIPKHIGHFNSAGTSSDLCGGGDCIMEVLDLIGSSKTLFLIFNVSTFELVL
jgi:hypothetical protein